MFKVIQEHLLSDGVYNYQDTETTRLLDASGTLMQAISNELIECRPNEVANVAGISLKRSGIGFGNFRTQPKQDLLLREKQLSPVVEGGIIEIFNQLVLLRGDTHGHKKVANFMLQRSSPKQFETYVDFERVGYSEFVHGLTQLVHSTDSLKTPTELAWVTRHLVDSVHHATIHHVTVQTV